MVFPFPFQLSSVVGASRFLALCSKPVPRQRTWHQFAFTLPMSAAWSTQPTFSAFNSFCVFKVHSSCPCFVSDGWLSGAVNIHLAEEVAAPVFETATISLQSTGQAILLNLQQICKQVLSSSCEISTFSL